ncbi:MAG: hypothetical protein JXA03_05035 [Bacteroidales bacterium]|nr:hypothetical protein [Bacteroidales bacterium]
MEIGKWHLPAGLALPKRLRKGDAGRNVIRKMIFINQHWSLYRENWKA